MLRLDSGEGRIRIWEGGGEYNVIRGLYKCFGMDTAVITAFADNKFGKLMKDFIEQGGVDTSLIYWKKTDVIRSICRNGINFNERGFVIRGAVGCSDMANFRLISRVGGGDLFASGLVYGLMAIGDTEKVVNYGAAHGVHGVLAMTTPGDTSKNP